jgi:hypothetical protein
MKCFITKSKKVPTNGEVANTRSSIWWTCCRLFTGKYRGRLDASLREVVDEESPRELVNAMLEIAETGVYSKEQIPSMGCSIKWQSER